MSIITTVKDSILIKDSLKSGNFEWHLQPQVNMTMIHMLEADEPITTTLEFRLGPASALIYCPIIMGGSRSEIMLSAVLQEGAQLTVGGAYALTGNQACSFTTLQEHRGRSSTSSLTINGVATDNASVIYQGAIKIQKNAAKSVAAQENKTLLIGAHAKAISIPSLEVLTNDVQCAHGSAIGPLQEDQLIYAQSRGLSLQNAKRLLITSFFAQALEGMLNENLRENIIARLVNKVLANPLS